MQINLKQREIIEALKHYIAQQGINLKGKSVDCTFTAGRKDSGISVEIQIEDQDIPGFSDPVDAVAEEVQDTPAAFEVPSTTTAPKEPGVGGPEVKAAPKILFG